MCCLRILVVLEPTLNTLEYIFYKAVHLPCMVLYTHQLNFYLPVTDIVSALHISLWQGPFPDQLSTLPNAIPESPCLCSSFATRVYILHFPCRAQNARNYTPQKQHSTNGYWELLDTYQRVSPLQ